MTRRRLNPTGGGLFWCRHHGDQKYPSCPACFQEALEDGSPRDTGCKRHSQLARRTYSAGSTGIGAKDED